jgi:acyl carrier protein
MNKENFIELFKETLEMEGQEVNMDDNFRDYEEWDSLAVLSLLATINEEYNIIIPRKEFDNMIIVRDIVGYIEGI